MSVELMLKTLEYLSPCGMGVTEDYSLSRCTIRSMCNNQYEICSALHAHQLARFLIEGANVVEERRNLMEYLVPRLGQPAVTLNKKVLTLSTENQGQFITEIVDLAPRMVKFCTYLTEGWLEISHDYIKKKSRSKIAALETLSSLAKQADTYSGDQQGAQNLVNLMKGELRKAINFGLEELEIIRTWAVTFGLHDLIRKKELTLPNRVDILIKPASDTLVESW